MCPPQRPRVQTPKSSLNLMSWFRIYFYPRWSGESCNENESGESKKGSFPLRSLCYRGQQLTVIQFEVFCQRTSLLMYRMTSAIDVRWNRSPTVEMKTFSISFQKTITSWEALRVKIINTQMTVVSGIRQKGRVVKLHFVVEKNYSVKHLTLRDGVYCSDKSVSGKKVYETIGPHRQKH